MSYHEWQKNHYATSQVSYTNLVRDRNYTLVHIGPISMSIPRNINHPVNGSKYLVPSFTKHLNHDFLGVSRIWKRTKNRVSLPPSVASRTPRPFLHAADEDPVLSPHDTLESFGCQWSPWVKRTTPAERRKPMVLTWVVLRYPRKNEYSDTPNDPWGRRP